MSVDRQAQKAAWRKEAKQLLREMNRESLIEIGKKMAEHILVSPLWQQAQVIFCFVGTATEVDTHPLIEAALFQGKQVCVPRCREKGVMEAVPIRAFSDLQPGKYGISEPEDHLLPIDPAMIDLCVVPCLRAGRDGGRLGHGGGYYDRFLTGQQMIRLCLCPGVLCRDGLPMTEQDVIMEYLVTEEGLFEVKK